MGEKMVLVLCLTMLCTGVSTAAVAGDEPARVLFIPFHSTVSLHNQWRLEEDVPRWFSQTVDTAATYRHRFETVPFDTVQALIAQNGWSRSTLLTRAVMQRLARYFDASLVVTGDIHTFTVIKRSLNADFPFSSQQEYTQGLAGHGGVMVMGEAHAYVVKIDMDMAVYDPHRARQIAVTSLATDKMRKGIDVWFPFQPDNSVVNFSRMKRTAFGSPSFRKSVLGAVMTTFSQDAGTVIARNLPQQEKDVAAADKTYLEGTVLQRTRGHVYIDLGSADNLFQGEVLEVTRPGTPFLNARGDTLGWSSEVIATIKVRFIRGRHFSEALIVSQTDSLMPGDRVRSAAAVKESSASGSAPPDE
jgi:hypothetical protein